MPENFNKQPEFAVNPEAELDITNVRNKIHRLISYDGNLAEAKELFDSLAHNQQELPEIKQVLLQEFTETLFRPSQGINMAESLASDFNLSAYEKNKNISEYISKGRGAYYDVDFLKNIRSIMEKYDIPKEKIAQSAYIAREAYPSFYDKSNLDNLAKILGLDEKRIEQETNSIFLHLIESISKENFSDDDFKSHNLNNKALNATHDLRRLLERFTLNNDLVYPAILSLLKKCVIEAPGQTRFMKEIIEASHLPEDLLNTPEIAEPYYQYTIKKLEKGYGEETQNSYNLDRIVGDFSKRQGWSLTPQFIILPDEYYHKKELSEWIEKSIEQFISKTIYESDIEQLTDTFIPEDVIAKALAKAMISRKIEEEPLQENLIKLLEQIPISPEVKKEAAKEIIPKALISADTSTVDYIRTHVATFSKSEIEQACRVAFFSTTEFQHKRILNEYAGGSIDPTLTKTVGLFGDFANESNYELVSSLLKGVVNNKAKQFGISKSGQEGMVQLEKRLQGLKSEFLSEDFNADTLLNSDIAQDFFKSYIRYEDAQFGGHDEIGFQETLLQYKQGEENGSRKKLNPNLTPSGEVKIASVDKDAQNQFQWGEHFLPRYATLVTDIQAAIKQSQEKSPISKLVDIIETKRKSVLVDLKNKSEKIENQKASANLNERIQNLETINIRSLKDFQSNFLVLSSFKEFHEEIRKIMFAWSVNKNRSRVNEKLEKVEPTHPNVEDVSDVIDFIDHITNQETMAKYFTDKQAKNAFEKLTSTVALQEELSRAQNQGTKGTKSFDFVPTRGLLMEFSGHIADACWAEKYNIGEEFPNFSSVTFVQNKGASFERLAGASLLIEAKSKKGDDLLIIRGLNPLQNIINGLSAEDFYTKFIEYLNPIAEKMGRKLAIVIDDHSGGSSTNRPVLFNYLKGLELRKVILDTKPNTEFNGYDITHDCFLV